MNITFIHEPTGGQAPAGNSVSGTDLCQVSASQLNITFIHEPTDLQCGQAVLAMITGISAADVCAELHNDRETKLSEMRSYLSAHGYTMKMPRLEASDKSSLPSLCVLSLETPRCWHWSLYADGTFYDPEHGVMDDFPECGRKYYWEVITDEK